MIPKAPSFEQLLSDKALDRQKCDGAYYDNLYKLYGHISILNGRAAEGCDTNELKNDLSAVSGLFFSLCGETFTKQKQARNKPQKEPQAATKPANFIHAGAGWIRCPLCGTRMVKVNSSTVIKNLPAYCKWCKKEVSVSWWK